MKKIKRILALALALTLCLGLAATVFAALPSYDVIASRMSMSDSLNEKPRTAAPMKRALRPA